jgi:3-methyladenine DNA glycosylase Mpg
VTQAFGIDRAWNEYDLCAADARLFLADGPDCPETIPAARPRVGLRNTPEPWRSLPWNLKLRDQIA